MGQIWLLVFNKPPCRRRLDLENPTRIFATGVCFASIKSDYLEDRTGLRRLIRYAEIVVLAILLVFAGFIYRELKMLRAAVGLASKYHPNPCIRRPSTVSNPKCTAWNLRQSLRSTTADFCNQSRPCTISNRRPKMRPTPGPTCKPVPFVN